MAKSFEMVSRKVPHVSTKHRTIVTDIPNQGSLDIIAELRTYEPRSMSGQPLVVWDHAEGFQVYDKFGNRWLDFSSGVLVANAGHTNPRIQKAILAQVEHGLLHNYCFPSEARAKLTKRLAEISPDPLKKVFLLTTGAEATECAIKLMRTWGEKVSGGSRKIKIVTFVDDFHGRTMGAQMAGGSPKGKAWIVNHDPDMHTVPFPNAFRHEWADETRADYSDETCFDRWLSYLVEQKIDFDDIAGFLPESFQGGWVQLMPVGFAKRLRAFCDRHGILLAFDEVQAGFGRSGKLFTFQHYGIEADLVCCGKGITSSLPLSAVIGRADVMDVYGPNEMTSTHTGNPVCAAAALANIDFLFENDVIGNAARLEPVCREALGALRAKHPDVIGSLHGVGLAWGLVFTKPGSKEIDPDLAHDVVRICIESGLMLFAPVGTGATIKVTPPLVITEEALREGLGVLADAVEAALALRRP